LHQDYRAGRLLTGQLKARCIKLLQEFTGAFQEVCYGPSTYMGGFINDCMQRRKKVTDDEVKAFMDANRQIVPTLGKKPNAE
jgi:tryptophanyl-tRNA synthetase